MPKAACWAFLKIKKIEVKRIQDISSAELVKEGIESMDAYRAMWERLDGEESRARNEWCLC